MIFHGNQAIRYFLRLLLSDETLLSFFVIGCFIEKIEEFHQITKTLKNNGFSSNKCSFKK